MTRYLTPSVLLALAGCSPWGDFPSDGYNYIDETLWDPAGVALDDGLYFRLPRAGELIRVSPDEEEAATIELTGEPQQLIGLPDGSGLLATTRALSCDMADEELETVQDCMSEYGEDYLMEHHFLAKISGGAVDSMLEIPLPYNAVAFTPDGTQAVVYLDYEAGLDLDVDGVVNLTEVLFMDLATGEGTLRSVGFSADRILFTPEADKAVVLSRSQVMVVEMTSGAYEVLVTYPLTLDADSSISPLDAVLTPDGRYAMITIASSGDLYILDLEMESITMVSLPTAPSDMTLDTVSEQTLLVYSSQKQLDLVDHVYFETSTLDLEEPANTLLQGNGYALLYNSTSSNLRDLYKVDLSDNSIAEFRPENPVTEVFLSPDEGSAVAFMRPESSSNSGLEGYADNYYGVSILDLLDISNNQGDSIDLLTESAPLGLAFSGTEDVSALVLLEGVQDLLTIHLGSGSSDTIRVDAPPLEIGSFGESGFFITQDSALGMVSFLSAEGELSTIGGFAAQGLIRETTSLYNPSSQE